MAARGKALTRVALLLVSAAAGGCSSNGALPSTGEPPSTTFSHQALPELFELQADLPVAWRAVVSEASRGADCGVLGQSEADGLLSWCSTFAKKYDKGAYILDAGAFDEGVVITTVLI